MQQQFTQGQIQQQFLQQQQIHHGQQAQFTPQRAAPQHTPGKRGGGHGGSGMRVLSYLYDLRKCLGMGREKGKSTIRNASAQEPGINGIGEDNISTKDVLTP